MCEHVKSAEYDALKLTESGNKKSKFDRLIEQTAIFFNNYYF